jgi:hypothetical protein
MELEINKRKPGNWFPSTQYEVQQKLNSGVNFVWNLTFWFIKLERIKQTDIN